MSLQSAIGTYLPLVEDELRLALATPHPTLAPFYGMMQYHLGWCDAMLKPTDAPSGKRLRPLFCMLACRAAGGEPSQAVPAAASIELLHNFSLIHDDIEDNCDMRRHRPTIWSIWGQPQAINAGDGMFSLAYLNMGRLACIGVTARLANMASQAFHEACLTLTEGQYLDMSFEARFEIELDDYLWMIQDKTAALLATSTRVGAVLADASNETVGAYREFGAAVGMAFQIEDDILGIWGDEKQTGKPVASDIRQRKKTLPLVHAIARLNQEGGAAEQRRLEALYAAGPALDEAAIAEVVGILESAGARRRCEDQARQYQELAMDHLRTASRAAGSDLEGVQMLRELAESLLGRES
jgi:geranylgeranyl diphosphate synthase, type I